MWVGVYTHMIGYTWVGMYPRDGYAESFVTSVEWHLIYMHHVHNDADDILLMTVFHTSLVHAFV